ncbi:glycine zipper 2TM domain-containing protein [Phenylobacterium sp.]|uniref:glycine zipper 2TM domain-containing protein n=1 Tax=Phenylobacterium sp. TaxID=1871053 RepID=UPI002621AF61|nr:glycine zipper 2TM domain-containing protein [Phenylobacterium sp.]
MNRKTFARGLIAAVAGAGALGAVGVAAQAQPYGQYGYYGGGYPGCQQQSSNRGLVGALIGGGLGAVVGANMAANHHRSDGGLVGGGVGALVGAGIGSSSAPCRQVPLPPPPPGPPPAAYNAEPPYGDYSYQYEGRDDGPGWAYGRHGERYRLADGQAADDGCTLAESPVYLPDGRVQKRFVRVCLDANGRYQVVN